MIEPSYLLMITYINNIAQKIRIYEGITNNANYFSKISLKINVQILNIILKILKVYWSEKNK